MTMISEKTVFACFCSIYAFRSQMVLRIWSKSLGTRLLRTTGLIEIP